MDGALLAGQQAGAHLDAAGPKGKGGGELPAISDAAGGDDGDAHRVHHLGHQGHGGQLADVAAALAALGDDAVDAIALQPLGQNGGGYHGEHLDTRLFPGGDVFAGVARAGGHHLHPLLCHHLGQSVDVGIHQHQVDAEGLAGVRLGGADLGPQGLGVHPAGGNQAQGTRVGHGGGERSGGDVGHAALDDGELNPQKLV